MSETTFQDSFRRRLNPQFGFASSDPMSSGITDMAMMNNSNDSEADPLQFKQEMSSHQQEPTKKKYARTPPKCKLCLVRFKNYSRLETHMKKEHPDSEKVYCEVCNKAFHTRVIMLTHHRAVHRKKRDEIAEKHKDTRLGIKDSQCHICGVSIAKIHLKDHVDGTHLKKKKSCEHCGKEYVSTYGLNNHILNKHPEKTDRTRQQCHKCERSFLRSSQLRNHLYKVHKETITCEFCGEEFAMPLQVRKHMKNEHPAEWEEAEKNRVRGGDCPICQKFYYDKYDLQRHVKLHESPSFKCDICSKIFSRKQTLQTHISLVHDNRDVKPFSCDFCQKKLKHKHALKYHLLRYHNVNLANEKPCKSDQDKKFNCSICFRSFSTKQHMIRHMFQHEDNTNEKSAAPENGHHTNEDSEKDVTFGEEGFVEEITVKPHPKPRQRKSTQEDKVSLTEELTEDKYDLSTVVEVKSEIKPESSLKDFHSDFDSLTEATVKNEPLEENTDLITRAPKTSFFKEAKEDEIVSEDIKHEPSTTMMDALDKVIPNLGPLSPFEGEETNESNDLVPEYPENEISRNESDVDQLQPNKSQVEDIKDDNSIHEKMEYCNNESDMDDQLSPYGSEAEGVEHDSDYVLVKSESDKFACQVCKKEFASKQYRRIHHKSAHLGLMHNCEHCNLQFAIKSKLDHHVAKCHPKATEGGDKKCNHCGKTFLTAVYLNQHKILVHPGGEKCKICSEDFSTEAFLERHTRSLHPEEYKSMMKLKKQRQRVDCKVCGKDLCNKTALELHTKQLHKGESRFCCDHCKDRFRTARNLNNHIMSDHPDVSRIACEICDKEFGLQSCLNAHKYAVHSDRPRYAYKCTKCDFKSKASSVLEKHVSAEHPESEKFQCDKCGKSWYVKASLINHRSAVHDRKQISKDLKKDKPPAMCDICGKEFNRRAYLRNHIKVIHNKEKPHKCEFCEKTFSQKQFMKLHVDSVHLKVKKHQCPHCGELFALKIYLKSHITFKHTEKAFTCQYCEKDFSTKQQMQRHSQRMHKKETLLSCQMCGIDFKKEGDLLFHIQNSHEIKTESLV